MGALFISRDMRHLLTLAAGIGFILNAFTPTLASAAPPIVELTSPTDGATWGPSFSFSASATATDTEGAIVKVEFYLGGTLSGTSYSQVAGSLGLFEVNLSPRPTNAGAYMLTARAFDSSGDFTTSAPRTLNVSQAPAAPIVTTGEATFPFSSTDARLNGTVSTEARLIGNYEAYFEVGVSTSYGSVTTSASYPAGYLIRVHFPNPPPAISSISLPIENLSRGTTYHYRLVVKYFATITFGEDATFTTPLNFAPTAKDKLIVLTGAGPHPVFLFNDSGTSYVEDRDREGLTLAVRTLPIHGTVTLVDSALGKYFSYTPNATFDTEDDFTYIVSDEHGGTATATVRVIRVAKRVAGRYVTTIQALDNASGNIPGHAVGLLTMDITSTRAFTGVLNLFGKRYPFIGRLSGNDLRFGIWIEPADDLPIGMRLAFVAGPLGVQLEGYVLTGDPRWVTHTITPTAALVSPIDAPEAGTYTVALSSDETGAYLGNGYLSGQVSKTGSVIFTGRTGDGQAFSFGTQLRAMSTAQFFVTAGPDSGDRINGSIRFPRANAEECTGELFWSKAPRASSYYQDGFKGRMTATGSRLHLTPGDPNILDYSTSLAGLDIVFNDVAGNELLAGSLSGPNETALTFIPSPTSVTLPKVQFKVNHLRGTFSGSFQATSENGITRNFVGVLLQHQNTGTGLSVIGRRTGSVTLTPK